MKPCCGQLEVPDSGWDIRPHLNHGGLWWNYLEALKVSIRSTQTTESLVTPEQIPCVAQGSEDPTRYPKLPEIIQVLRDQANSWLVTRLAVALGHCDKYLFDLANQAYRQSEQDSYFHAMRQLRDFQHSVIPKFSDNLNLGFYQCVNNGEKKREIIASNLSLIDNDDMEELLAIEAIAKGSLVQNKTALERLAMRISYVVGGHYSGRNIPISPGKIYSALSLSIHELNIELQARLAIYGVVAEHLVQHLPELYAETNLFLAEKKILVELEEPQEKSRKQSNRLLQSIDEGLFGEPVKLDEASESDSSRSSGYYRDGSTFTPSSEISPEYLLSAELMSEELKSEHLTSDQLIWDKQGPAEIGPTENHQKPTEPQNISNTLGSLERFNNGEARHLLTLLTQLQSSLTPAALTRPGGLRKILTRLDKTAHNSIYRSPQRTTLRVIDGLFSAMLEERCLANPLRELLARLQIPLARAAIIDDDLLLRPDHSARQLINALAMAGLAVQSEDDDSLKADPLYTKMSDIVNRVVSDYDKDSQVFADLLSEFKVYTERDQKRLEHMEKRLQDAEEGRQKADAARQVVSKTIADISQNLVIRALVNEFIDKAWQQVMFVILLKSGAESESWKDAVQTLRLIVDGSHNLTSAQVCEKNRLAFPPLAKKIQQGFELIAFDAFEGEQLLRKLTDLMSNLTPQVVNKIASTNDDNSALALDKLKKELSGAPSEKRQLARSDEIKAVESIDEQYLAQAKTLSRGSWLDYQAANGKVLRCRLAAVIQSTSNYIFVNRLGQKVLEKSLLALALSFKTGELKVIDSSKLFDRALAKVIIGLRNDQEAESENRYSH
jgi:hypothetical protein